MTEANKLDIEVCVTPVMPIKLGQHSTQVTFSKASFYALLPAK
jgi:hypothetical protein